MRKHLLLTLATMLLLVGTAGLLRAIAGPAQGQGRAQGQRPADQPVTADSRFMTTAAQSGAAEVALATLAQEKSTTARVKAIAQKIQTDHVRANGELRAIAKKKNVTIPETADPAHTAAHDRLSALSGAAFDKAWIAQMIKDHETAVDLFTKQSKGSGDAEVRAFAAQTLPALQAHLKQVQDLSTAGSGGSRGRGRR